MAWSRAVTPPSSKPPTLPKAHRWARPPYAIDRDAPRLVVQIVGRRDIPLGLMEVAHPDWEHTRALWLGAPALYAALEEAIPVLAEHADPTLTRRALEALYLAAGKDPRRVTWKPTP